MPSELPVSNPQSGRLRARIQPFRPFVNTPCAVPSGVKIVSIALPLVGLLASGL